MMRFEIIQSCSQDESTAKKTEMAKFGQLQELVSPTYTVEHFRQSNVLTIGHFKGQIKVEKRINK